MSATPITIDWRGHTYTINPLVMDVIKTLERELISEHVEALAETWDMFVRRGLLTADQAVERGTEETKKCRRERTFTFGSETMNQILFDSPTVPDPEKAKAQQALFKRDPAAAAAYMDSLPKSAWLNKLRLFSLMMKRDDGAKVTTDEVVGINNEKKTEFMSKIGMIFEDSMPDPKGTAGAAA